MILFKNSLFLLFIATVFIVASNGHSLRLDSERLGGNIHKISKSVHHYYGEEDKESHKLWVFFNSKNFNQDGHQCSVDIDHTLSNQQEGSKILKITNKALERRKRRAQVSGLSEDDLPVQQSLIDSVLKCGQVEEHQYMTLHQRSKWMNSVSVSIDLDIHDSQSHKEKLLNQILNCITEKKFVEKIDLVRKFASSKSGHEITNQNDHQFKETELQEPQLVDAGNWRQRKTLSTAYEEEIFFNNTFSGIKQVNAIGAHQQGYDGNGLIVLILDSGFLTSHEVFKNLSIIGTYDFINHQENVTSPFGDKQNTHGTATLSTIAGYKPGTMVGPAYRAHFLLAKTEDVAEEKIQEEDYWVSGVEWGEAHGAELVSSSLGYTLWYKYYDMNGTYATITKAADKAVSKGMVVVSSAGNDGTKGIGAPADGFNVISVGAIDTDGKATFFSSQGPSSDGRVKPDITAQGMNNFVADARCNTCYTRMSGTSFSCPLAAGSIALIMQRNPTWTPQQVYTAVTSTASQYSKPDSIKGYGVLNTVEAMNFSPLSASLDCRSVGCSGHGGCCDGVCHCAPDHYGKFCQYRKVGCGANCINRGGTCATDKFQFTFICTGGMTSIDTAPSSCKICNGKVDSCGVCGGNNTCAGCDGVAFSRKKIDTCGVCGGDGICKTVVVEPGRDNSSNVTKIAIGASVGGVALVALISITIFFAKKRALNYKQQGFISLEKASTTEIDNEDLFTNAINEN